MKRLSWWLTVFASLCVCGVGSADASLAAKPAKATTKPAKVRTKPAKTTAAAPAATETFVDPDTEAKAGDDVVSTLLWLPNGDYELDLQNTSALGYIDTFTWVPPAGMTVTGITKTAHGSCQVVSGDIACEGKVPPPICTCRVGGTLIVDFTATGNSPTYVDGHILWFGLVGGQTLITTITPVPYHIPSFISSKNV